MVLNPTGGDLGLESVQGALRRHLEARSERLEVYRVRGGDDIPAVVRDAVERGYTICVAGGGDGTASAVANGLLGTQALLGVIPIGTGSVLARELGIPLAADKACALIAGPHAVKIIDAMRIRDRCCFLNLSAGISALTMRDTPGHRKHRLGVAAYVWTGLRSLAGFHPGRFSLEVDQERLWARASEVLVLNGGVPVRALIGNRRPASLDDGELNVYILRTRTLGDYLSLAWKLLLGRERLDPRVRFAVARQRVWISSEPKLPVQGDGEPIGDTPVDIHLVRRAVRVIVPA